LTVMSDTYNIHSVEITLSTLDLVIYYSVFAISVDKSDFLAFEQGNAWRYRSFDVFIGNSKTLSITRELQSPSVQVHNDPNDVSPPRTLGVLLSNIFVNLLA